MPKPVAEHPSSIAGGIRLRLDPAPRLALAAGEDRAHHRPAEQDGAFALHAGALRRQLRLVPPCSRTSPSNVTPATRCPLSISSTSQRKFAAYWRERSDEG